MIREKPVVPFPWCKNSGELSEVGEWMLTLDGEAVPTPNHEFSDPPSNILLAKNKEGMFRALLCDHNLRILLWRDPMFGPGGELDPSSPENFGRWSRLGSKARSYLLKAYDSHWTEDWVRFTLKSFIKR